MLYKSPVEAFSDEVGKADLLFDTADTISFEMAALLDRLNAEFGEEYEYWSTKDAHPLDLPKKQKKWLKEIKEEPTTYANLSPDWHAIDALHALHAAGYHITISSDRPAEMADVSKRWYDYWGVPYDDIEINGPDSKADIIKDHVEKGNPIILFDDDPRQMWTFPQDGVEVWTQRKPWTPADFSPPNCFVFDSWNEVLHRLAPQFTAAAKSRIIRFPEQADRELQMRAVVGGYPARTVKYTEDQPRDDRGRFGESGSSASTMSTSEWDRQASAYQQRLTDAQQHAIESYKGWASAVNLPLRGKGELDKEGKSTVRLLDRAIEYGHLSEATVLTRMIADAPAITNLQPGDSFVDKGYVSTTTSDEYTKSWLGGLGDGAKYATMLKIEAPADTHCAYGFTNRAEFENEKEVILPRGGTFTVRNVTPATETDPKIIELKWDGVK